MRPDTLLKCAVIWLVLLAATSPAATIDSTTAVRAANLSAEDRPADDIAFDYRASHVLKADLNGDGIEEVVYLLTTTCIAANFDCPNEVIVLTPIAAGDPRLRSHRDIDNSDVLDYRRRLAAVGYADDATLQIPGDVDTLAIDGQEIRVNFTVNAASNICKRSLEARLAGKVDPCPAPGPQTWRLAWKPTLLVRTR
jgi:hypothetical protein